MKEDQRSHQIRMAAFKWLKTQIELYGDVLPYNLLKNGFTYENEVIVLIGAKGIWKPKQIEYYPISLTSSIKSVYKDFITPDNKIIYRYRTGGPQVPDNLKLQKTYSDNIPLIYFHQVSKGYYMVHWPVFIVANNSLECYVTIEADNYNCFNQSETEDVAKDVNSDYGLRKYATREVIYRMHQRSFREKVLRAYQEHCAICKLKHRELLDAAHIIPDSQEGSATVDNGLSLCKIHHAAFDNNLLSITPDYNVIIRPDLMLEEDGPMLEYGIKAMNNQQIILPKSITQRPNKDWLSIRYEKFKQSI